MNILYGLKIAILLAHGFEQSEMIRPQKALEEAGAQVHLIAPEPGMVAGWDWNLEVPTVTMRFRVDATVDKVKAKDYDALFLPGGLMAPDDLRMNPKVIEFIKGFKHKPIGAICHGICPLIDVELVSGKTVTSWPSIKVDLKNAGATWVDKEVVRDGNLVTSRMPQDVPAFNKAFIEVLKEYHSNKFKKQKSLKN